MAGLIETGFIFLYNLGFFTTVVPFVLLYVILFALFERVKIFDNSEYHAVISFCFAFLTIYNVGIVENITLLLARVGLLFVIIVVLLIITGLLGLQGTLSSGFTIIVIVLYLAYVVAEIFIGSNLVDIINSIIPVDVLFPVIVSALVFGGVMWFILGGKSIEGSSSSGSSDNSSSKKNRSDRKSSGKDNGESERRESSNPKTDYSNLLNNPKSPRNVFESIGNENK